MGKLVDQTEKVTLAQTDIVYLVQSPYLAGDDRYAQIANLGNAVGRVIDRGDPAAADWTQAILTLDDAWHDLDCSSIVPASAKVIRFYIEMSSSEAASFKLRKKGNSNAISVATLISTGATLATKGYGQLDVFCSTDRIIQYRGLSVITALSITVVGWSL